MLILLHRYLAHDSFKMGGGFRILNPVIIHYIFVHSLSCFASQFTKDIYLDKSFSTEKNIGSDVRVLNLIIIDFQHPKLTKNVSSCFASQIK